MASNRVAVIDYGMGNLHSVASALEHVAPDAEVLISADKKVIESADHVIFPGVGAIRDCMAEIRRLGFDQLVPEIIASGKPVLGICVGMQALMQHSEENGGIECLSQLEGQVKFFGQDLHDEQGTHLKVPHMGWNQVGQLRDHPMWQGIEDGSRFYFVHSYYVSAERQDEVVGRCHYGVDFDVALSHNNLFAVQFHPEKSHTAGLQLLKNFVGWNGSV
jgi:glutamine amidotransferase